MLTGFDVLNRIGSAFTVNLRPATPIVIRQAGLLPDAEWAVVDKQLAVDAKAAAAAAAKSKPIASSAASKPAASMKTASAAASSA